MRAEGRHLAREDLFSQCHQLLRGEISREGFRAIRCDFSDFSKT